MTTSSNVYGFARACRPVYVDPHVALHNLVSVVNCISNLQQSFCVYLLQTVTRISQAGTKSVFSQSGNSREVTPILVAQTQSSGPQTRQECFSGPGPAIYLPSAILFSFSSYQRPSYTFLMKTKRRGRGTPSLNFHNVQLRCFIISLSLSSTTPQVLSPTIAAPPNVLPRRSSRLFSSDSSTTKVNGNSLHMCISFL